MSLQGTTEEGESRVSGQRPLRSCPYSQWQAGLYLDEDIVIAGGVHDVIADENEVCVLVGQGPQPIIVFLP